MNDRIYDYEVIFTIWGDPRRTVVYGRSEEEVKAKVLMTYPGQIDFVKITKLAYPD